MAVVSYTTSPPTLSPSRLPPGGPATAALAHTVGRRPQEAPPEMAVVCPRYSTRAPWVRPMEELLMSPDPALEGGKEAARVVHRLAPVVGCAQCGMVTMAWMAFQGKAASKRK